MSSKKNGVSRRAALKTTGGLAAMGVLGGAIVPAVHAAADETIRFALVGCGGRGNGAAEQALNTNKLGPIKLVALADVFQARLDNTHELFSSNMRYKAQVDVPPERRFLGFDKYKLAMDALQKGDIVILATPPAFRWPMFQYAIEKGLNVFMEKPTAVDAGSARKMIKLSEEADKKKLKVGVGLMCRHCPARQELFKRIRNGEIGDIVLLRCYRQAGPTGSAAVTKNNDPKMSELLHQIRNFHGFLWASGGAVSDFLIHNIDECCWMKDAWPIEVRGAGGRHYKTDKSGNPYIDQNFDTYSMEYIFEDGSRMRVEGRTMERCQQEFASYVHGSKNSATISARNHWPAHAAIFKGQKVGRSGDPIWEYPQPETQNPYQVEWDRLVTAIRQNLPHNEAKRGAEASLVTAMGRVAAHTGQLIKYEDYLKSDFELAPNVDKLSYDAPAPVLLGKDGKYPAPEPGHKGRREY